MENRTIVGIIGVGIWASAVAIGLVPLRTIDRDFAGLDCAMVHSVDSSGLAARVVHPDPSVNHALRVVPVPSCKP
jgi:hypothetical protein